MKLSRQTGGFTLVEVMIVVAIIGLLAAIAIPNFAKSREISHRKVCIANLRQLETAVQSWAIETRKASASPIVTDELFGSTNYIKNIVVCPVGGAYIYGNVGDPRHVMCNLSDGPDYHTLN